MKITLLLLTATMFVSAGCIGKINVPANTIRFRTAHGSLDVTHPQDTDMTNVVVSIATNGTVTANIGSLHTRNSPEVIDKTSAGQVAIIKAQADFVERTTKSISEAAGTIGGAGAKAAAK